MRSPLVRGGAKLTRRSQNMFRRDSEYTYLELSVGRLIAVHDGPELDGAPEAPRWWWKAASDVELESGRSLGACRTESHGAPVGWVAGGYSKSNVDGGDENRCARLGSGMLLLLSGCERGVGEGCWRGGNWPVMLTMAATGARLQRSSGPGADYEAIRSGRQRCGVAACGGTGVVKEEVSRWSVGELMPRAVDSAIAAWTKEGCVEVHKRHQTRRPTWAPPCRLASGERGAVGGV